jgi:molybdenum cofactor cytidylyltransferase
MEAPVIAGLFLAAGTGSRFGGNKLLREVAGMPLYSLGLSQATASRLADVIVVVGPDADNLERDIQERFAGDAKIRVERNANAARGMMTSLKKGLQVIGDQYEGAAVLLADMPLVTAIMIDALIDAFARRPSIVIPECGGELRHPRVIPARLFPEFLGLADGEKGIKIIEKYKVEIVRVPVGSELNYIDIDTPEDLKALENL